MKKHIFTHTILYTASMVLFADLFLWIMSRESGNYLPLILFTVFGFAASFGISCLLSKKADDEYNRLKGESDVRIQRMKEKYNRAVSALNSIDYGILIVDKDKRILFVNTAMTCYCHVHKSEKDCVGSSLSDIFQNDRLIRLVEETFEDRSSKTEEIKMNLPEPLIFKVSVTPLYPRNNKDTVAGVIVALQDVTNIIKLEKMRTEFVSNVTHELKTPLTSIRGFVETLRAGAINDKEVAEQFLDIIDIEADRLSTLINDILQLSEIESMKEDVNLNDYHLRTLFLDILPVLEKAAEQKNVIIHENIDDTIYVRVNPNRIKQLLMNLVDNAIKYNKDNGQIWVDAYRENETLILKVKDNGIGIPTEHHKRIFERFYRVDKGRSRNLGGTGLGLSIIKHIVNLYNGNIKMTSNPGEGTEFIISMPL
jgi:two-component system phosphate regulon sensor histidine kinase PhoR